MSLFNHAKNHACEKHSLTEKAKARSGKVLYMYNYYRCSYSLSVMVLSALKYLLGRASSSQCLEISVNVNINRVLATQGGRGYLCPLYYF